MFKTNKLVQQKSNFHHLLYFIRNSLSAIIGFSIVGLMLFLAIFGPYIAPYGPETAMPSDALQGPSLKHLFGTDTIGMDIFSRVISVPYVEVKI